MAATRDAILSGPDIVGRRYDFILSGGVSGVPIDTRPTLSAAK